MVLYNIMQYYNQKLYGGGILQVSDDVLVNLINN